VPTRIENIILRARDTLADPSAKRFSNERLLRLVSDGQQDIVKQSKILRSQFNLLPETNKAIYDLPTDVWQFTRASVKGIPVPFRTYDELDNFGSNANIMSDVYQLNSYGNEVDFGLHYSNWQEKTGPKVTTLVYDRMNVHQIRLFPIPNEESADFNYVFSSVYGVITDIGGGTFNSQYGVVTNITIVGYEVTISGNFGVVTSLQEALYPISIWYFQLAPDIATVNDNLVVSPMFDVALKYYVVGHALRDDLDVQNRQMGSESLSFYERELVLAKSSSAINNTQNRERVVNYSTAFDN